MRQIGKLDGTGMLKADGRELGPVEYEFTEYFDGSVRSAEGTINGDADALSSAFEAERASLVRDDTQFELEIIVSRFTAGYAAEVKVTGPLSSAT